MSSIPRKQTGFTIVELLIVIVVIGILAAITIVAYNGIQKRAQISTAKSDLRNFGQSMTAQLVDSQEITWPVWSAALKSASLYDQTRSQEGKTFAICENTVTNQFAIIAHSPVNKGEVDGMIMPAYIAGSVTEITYDINAPGVFVSEKICSLALPGYTSGTWTYRTS